MKNPTIKDMTSLQVGEWFVLEKAGNTKRGAAVWKCKCSCGSIGHVTGGDLRSGKSVSCGCKGSRTTIGSRSATHRMKGTRIHNCWSNMKARCNNLDNKSYGGKGITVCEEWKSFEAFYAWAMNSGYRDDLTIERKNNALGYSPDNCTWATRKQQARNRTIVHMADETTSFAEIAEQNGVPVGIVNSRVCSGGWDRDEAATTPVSSKRRQLPRNNLGRFEQSPKPWKRK